MIFFQERGLGGRVILFLLIAMLLTLFFSGCAPPPRVRITPISKSDLVLHPVNNKLPAVVLSHPSRTVLKSLVRLSQRHTDFPSEQAWDKVIVLLLEEGGKILIEGGMEGKVREQLNRIFITEAAHICVEEDERCRYYDEYVGGERDPYAVYARGERFWADFFADGKLIVTPGDQYTK